MNYKNDNLKNIFYNDIEIKIENKKILSFDDDFGTRKVIEFNNENNNDNNDNNIELKKNNEFLLPFGKYKGKSLESIEKMNT